jgi:hypothetical protein
MRIAIFVVAVAYAPCCHAGLIYLAQHRTVSASAVVTTPSEPADNESLSAPDFLPFSAQVTAVGTLSDPNYPPGNWAQGMAEVDSILAGNTIGASGQSSSGVAGGLLLAPHTNAGGSALIDVRFTIDQTADYFLSGLLHVNGVIAIPGSRPADVPISLIGPGVNFTADLRLAVEGFGVQDITLPVSQLAHLVEGGEYELSVSAVASQSSAAQPGIASPPAKPNIFADYSVTLAPVPGAEQYLPLGKHAGATRRADAPAAKSYGVGGRLVTVGHIRRNA